MKEPPCFSCRHEILKSCTRPMPDRTFADSIVWRPIKIASTAHVDKPAEYVYQHYCLGRFYQSIADVVIG